jgi:hypothetical protein
MTTETVTTAKVATIPFVLVRLRSPATQQTQLRVKLSLVARRRHTTSAATWATSSAVLVAVFTFGRLFAVRGAAGRTIVAFSQLIAAASTRNPASDTTNAQSCTSTINASGRLPLANNCLEPSAPTPRDVAWLRRNVKER